MIALELDSSGIGTRGVDGTVARTHDVHSIN